MKKLVLFILFLGAVFYFVTQNYAFKSGTSKDGKYSLILVDKTSGRIIQLLGK